MKRILIISPLRATKERTLVQNKELAQKLCMAVFKAGHAPFAPHAFYPDLLDDGDTTQRELGMAAGRAWARVADEAWVYTEYGISDGMRSDTANALLAKLTIKYDPPEFARIK